MFGKHIIKTHIINKVCTSGLQDPTPTGYEIIFVSCWAILISTLDAFHTIHFLGFTISGSIQIPNFTFLEPASFYQVRQFH